MNYSIMMMLSVVAAIPLVFGFLVWNSFRLHAKRTAQGGEGAARSN